MAVSTFSAAVSHILDGRLSPSPVRVCACVCVCVCATRVQAVFDERAFSRSQEELVQNCVDQINDLFPSSKKLKCTWSSVVKLGQALYREKPGQDKYRPTQATPIDNFFLCGSYTYQDYLDSMEGATRSGLMVADEIVARADGLAAASKAASAKAAAVA